MFIVFANNVIGFQLSIELKLEKFEKDIRQTIDKRNQQILYSISQCKLK